MLRSSADYDKSQGGGGRKFKTYEGENHAVVSREIFPSFHDPAMYNRPFSEKDVDPMRGPEPQKLMKMEPAYAIRSVTNPPADFQFCRRGRVA